MTSLSLISIIPNVFWLEAGGAMTRERKTWKGVMQQFVLLLLFAVLSAVIVGQIRARSAENAEQVQKRQAQIAEYNQEIQSLREQIQVERTEINSIETAYDVQVQQLKDNNKEFYNLYRKYTDSLELYRKLAGLTAVKGSGVIIRLDDSGLVQGSIIHDTYLIETVNVLKEAGAQAISINGQRVLATTELLCLGPSIRINGSREFAPYHIYAIGDPVVLAQAYQTSAIYKTIVAQNLIYDVQQSNSIVINAYSGNYKSLITKLFS